MLASGDSWRKVRLQRTIFDCLGQLKNKFDVDVSLQEGSLKILHKLLDRLLVDVRHPQELADSIRQRTADCFQDYSLNVLARFLTLARTAASISGKQTVASPYTSTNLPPFLIFLQLIDSASGAPLSPPGSARSEVIWTALSTPSRRTLARSVWCFGSPPPRITTPILSAFIDISTIFVTSAMGFNCKISVWAKLHRLNPSIESKRPGENTFTFFRAAL